MKTINDKILVASVVLYLGGITVLAVAANLSVDAQRMWTLGVLLVHCANVFFSLLFHAFVKSDYHFYPDSDGWSYVFISCDALQFWTLIGLLLTSCFNMIWFAWIVAFTGCCATLVKLIKMSDNYVALSKNDDHCILDRWNLAAFLLHTGSSLFMLPNVRMNLECKEVTEWKGMTTWTTSEWVGVNNNTKVDCSIDPCVVTRCTQKIGHGVPLESLTFAFHIGSACAHLFFLCAGHNFYQNIEKKGNPYRWLEYGITAPLMMVVILSSSGFTDIWIFTGAAMLTAVTQVFGWLAECSVNSLDAAFFKMRWPIFFAGVLSALPPWITLFIVYDANRNRPDADIPWFVTAIIISLFILFTCFALVMASRLYKPNQEWHVWGLGWTWFASWPRTQEKQNLHAEKCYILLSFVSKATLAWLLWFGAFRRTANDLQQAPLPPCVSSYVHP